MPAAGLDASGEDLPAQSSEFGCVQKVMWVLRAHGVS